MKDKNQIQKAETVSPLANAAALVAANGEMDVAKLKELLELQERWDATQAKKAYTQAMAEFKKNPPEILKDKTVRYKDVKYTHAGLHNVTTKINTELSKHGLTASWVTSQDNNSVKVTCKITHIMGHSEITSLSAPPDVTGSKNVIQAIGSTVTYLQRYTLLALTGLATYDQDDDGAGAGDKPKPKIPKLTAQNEKVLDAICVKLQESLTDGEPDQDKVAAIFLAQKGAYPTKMNMVAKAVAWLISLNQKDSWVKTRRRKGQMTEEEVEKHLEETSDATSVVSFSMSQREWVKSLYAQNVYQAI